MSKQKQQKNQRVTKLGRNTNNGLKAGVTYWNVNNSSGNRNHNIGSHLTLRALLIYSEDHRTMPLGKTQNKTSPVLVEQSKAPR